MSSTFGTITTVRLGIYAAQKGLDKGFHIHVTTVSPIFLLSVHMKIMKQF